jgi:hypothetical protein
MDFMGCNVPLSEHSDHECAKVAIGEALRNGCLFLVLGSGASRGVGLPMWWELVNACSRAVELQEDMTKDTPNEKLRARMEEVEAVAGTFESYQEVVHDAIYEGTTYDRRMVTKELLIALGAMVMPSRRGHANVVVTFNFDDVLEWYLRLHGFVVEVVHELPRLELAVDVTVYHPHGFLPRDGYSGRGSKFLILSQVAYEGRAADVVNEWTELSRKLFCSRFALFVGLSGDDPALRTMLTGTQKEIGEGRITGWWLRREQAQSTTAEELRRRNVAPVEFQSHDDIAGFILDTCQYAASER